MGKRVKPKGRNPRKQLRSQGSDLDPPQDPSDPTPDAANEEETTKTREGCGHYTKEDLHVNKILRSILYSTSDFSSCNHCRDELPQVNRKGGGSGGKKKKKKGGGVGPRGGEVEPNPDPIWVCLDCGKSFCGGAVDKEVPYGHARRHAKQERHNWAVGPNSKDTAWCFLCNAEVPIEMPPIEEETISNPKPTSEPDYTKAMKSDAKTEPLSFHTGPHHHNIRGLSNLGNTCFFNSVLQNLLALKMLRESLLTPPNSEPDNTVTIVKGPLTMSLRKLFLETNGGEDCKGVLSPKNLFGNICAKAPQFRGYQQQDSHELLRYLLDGLNTEETSARKSELADSDKIGGVDETGPTLVGSLFSGRLSSTVCCLECGYTSVVHEPFLDLSLPLPSKKTSSVAKKGGNRAPLARGRGRSQRARDRPGPKSSPVDEEKTRKLEASSLKEEGATESAAAVKAGSDSSEVVSGSIEEVDGSGAGAGPQNSADDVADYGWMNFLVDQSTSDIAQEASEAEPAGLDVAGTESMVPEVQPNGKVVEAGAAGVRAGAEGPNSTSSRADDANCSAMGMGMKSTVSEAVVDSAEELTASKADTGAWSNTGHACSMESMGSANGSVAKLDDDSTSRDSSPCIISDEQEGTFKANISELNGNNNELSDEPDKPDSAVHHANLLQDQSDKHSAVSNAKVDNAKASSSSFGSDKEQILKANTVKVGDDNGWLPGEHKEVDGTDHKAQDDIDWLHDQSDKVNGIVPEANAPDDMDWLVDEGSEKYSMVVNMSVNAYSHSESYALESTVIKVDDCVPGSAVFKESNPLCMGVAQPGSKSASFNMSLTSNNSDSQDPCGDSTIDTLGLSNNTASNEETAESSITRENTETDTNVDTGTGNVLHPSNGAIESKTSLCTVNVETEVQQEVDFDGFGDMFNEPEEAFGPMNRPDPKPEDEDDSDSIFWCSSATFSGLGFNNEEVDNSDKPASVVSCLELFTKPELLTGEHAWYCEKCSALQSGETDQDCRKGQKKNKAMRNAMKRYLLDRAPQVLTVHLKRFGVDTRGRLSKLRGHVNFEEILDLTPYINERFNNNEKCVYRLIGLVEHSGSMSGGHYVAYVRGEKTLKGGVQGPTWFYASDAHVKEVSLSEVLRSEAYLLFYERVGNENSSSS